MKYIKYKLYIYIYIYTTICLYDHTTIYHSSTAASVQYTSILDKIY